MDLLEESKKFLKLQSYIQDNLHELLERRYEQGTCKKCLPIPNTPYCVVMSHQDGEMERGMVKHEYDYLTFLRQEGFSVVDVIGQPFELRFGEGTRCAFIERYIADAVFIEAKTPATLKLFIFAALTGTEVFMTEAWFLKKNQIENTIKQKLTSERFDTIKLSATRLAEQFNDLLTKMEEKGIEISDLQGLITQSGEFIIIDPLDVINVNKEYSKADSISGVSKAIDVDFVTFLKETKNWLNQAISICQSITKAKTIECLKEQLIERKSKVLVFSGMVEQNAGSLRQFLFKKNHPVLTESKKHRP